MAPAVKEHFGCRRKFAKRNMQPVNDVIFKMNEYRECSDRKCGWTPY